MYNVIYIDAQGTETPLAHDLDDRGDACTLAREGGPARLKWCGKSAPAPW